MKNIYAMLFHTENITLYIHEKILCVMTLHIESATLCSKSENTDHKARLQPCAQTQFTEQILFNEATF